MPQDADDAAGEVAAMQFAGGMTIAEVAAQWDREPRWVEQAIRNALLASIPRRDGGLKAPRVEQRAGRSDEAQAALAAQGVLPWRKV